MFAEYGDKPIKEYVLRLRLEHSAYRLKISSDPIVQIALEGGFKTHESFTRALKKQFGVSPKAFRKDFIRTTEIRKRKIGLNYVGQNAFANNSVLLPNQSTAVRVYVDQFHPILIVLICYTGSYECILPARLSYFASTRGTPLALAVMLEENNTKF